MLENLLSTNIILYCQHWIQTVRFYRYILCLPVNLSTDWFIEFKLTSTSYLSIADETRASIKSVHGQGVTLAMQVHNIYELRQSMQDKGLHPTSISKHVWGAWVFNIFDPEGHRIEFWQYLAAKE